MWRSSMTPGVAQLPKGMCLRPESARSLLHAERFARKALSPMDTAITIEFSSALAGSVQPYDLFRKIWENTRRAWNYRVKQGAAQGTFDAIAVWENPSNGPIHVHWLLRWSPLDRDDLDKRIRRALAKLAPNMPSRCLMVQPATTTSQIAKYMAKGIDAPRQVRNSSATSPRGYLVVFDARRRNVAGANDALAEADALHFEKAEISYDPDFAAIRPDFEVPVRFFLRPRRSHFADAA